MSDRCASDHRLEGLASIADAALSSAIPGSTLNANCDFLGALRNKLGSLGSPRRTDRLQPLLLPDSGTRYGTRSVLLDPPKVHLERYNGFRWTKFAILSAGSQRLRANARLSDRPGDLAKLLALLGTERVNVVSVEHHREGMEISIGETEIELTLVTRDPAHCDEILAPWTLHAESARVVTVLFADLVGFTARSETPRMGRPCDANRTDRR